MYTRGAKIAGSVLRAHKRTVVKDTSCPFCVDQQESVQHFVAECPQYAEAKEAHEQLLKMRWNEKIESTELFRHGIDLDGRNFAADEPQGEDHYRKRWEELIVDPKRKVQVLLGSAGDRQASVEDHDEGLAEV